ncbi:MAG: MFS transporter [Oscillospiraceae bacterium]|nr:MFS transporter [Oscillospiraceae bacterium]
MANQPATAPRRKTNFNYGVKGWGCIIYVMIAWMFISGGWWNATAQNTMVALKAAQLGLESADVLQMNSIIGYLTIIPCFILGILYGKYGTRIMFTLSCIIGGIATCFYGYVDSVAGYYIAVFLIFAMAASSSQVAEPMIITNWFPTKKGSALGWASIGNNLANLITLTILTALIAWGGSGRAMVVFGIATIFWGVINWIFFPVDPRKVGFEPDNGDFTQEEMDALKTRMSGPRVWTMKEVLMNKNFWLVIIGYGLLFMVSSGFLQQIVPYQISMGVSASTASTYMKLLPLFALPGSIFGGWLDQKLGTRRAGLLMAGGYIISALCGGVLPFNTVTNIIFVFLFFFMTGSNANMVMSHIMSLFGPRDYPSIWGRSAVALQIFTVTAPLILSQSLKTTGSYRGAYAAFMVASIIAFVLIFFAANRIDKEPGQKPTACYKN